MTTPAQRLATTLVDELVRCGVADVVASPGARCAPIAQALYQHPALRLHVRIDERSASFLALGIAKVTHRPVAMVCTSGTAVANLHPAVLEAHHSRIPLLLLTADRPPELRATGANQTTDQTNIFGSAVRFFAELDCAIPIGHANRFWRSVVCRAVAAGRDGPVHLNVSLREPLGSNEPFTFATEDTESAVAGRSTESRWTDMRAATITGSQREVEVPARGVVVVGDCVADPGQAVTFAENVGWPVLAEPHSGARFGPNAITHYVDLLRTPAFLDRAATEMVITFGRPGLSRQLLSFLDAAAEHIVIDSHHDWADPTRSATRVLPTLGRVRAEPADPAWLALWRDSDMAADHASETVLATAEPSEPAIARRLGASLPPGSLLFVGSSMPIRDLERTMRPRSDIRVIANRGLAGIDGAVSTAIGAALAHQNTDGGRAFALLGDLTLLHDQNGLIIGPGQPKPDLVLVVVNNNGGGIFSLLPHTRRANGFESLFGTPHDADLAAVAAAAGWPHTHVTTIEELGAATLDCPGPRIVEIRTDRAANAAIHSALDTATRAALDILLHPQTDPPPRPALVPSR